VVKEWKVNLQKERIAVDYGRMLTNNQRTFDETKKGTNLHSYIYMRFLCAVAGKRGCRPPFFIEVDPASVSRLGADAGPSANSVR